MLQMSKTTRTSGHETAFSIRDDRDSLLSRGAVMNRTVIAALSLICADATTPLLAVEGFPKADAIQSTYDELDYQRAVQVYLWAQPLVSTSAFAARMRDNLGATDMQTIPIFEQGATPKQVIFTANSQSIYQFST